MLTSTDQFTSVFIENTEKRSRTAHQGKSHTGISPLKLPLLLEGEHLREKIRTNTRNAASLIKACNYPPKNGHQAQYLLEAFNLWFDTLQEDMVDIEGYRSKRKELGIPCSNPRYRIWKVLYDPTSSPVESISSDMACFAENLMEKIRCTSKETYPELLAFADYQIDTVIHPWLDGCGRFATALVMWIAAQFPAFPLPVFGDRIEHYKSLNGSVADHAEYFRKCLSREGNH